jgi:CPA2 family monovalent cation:H+ antiporter-2
MEIPALINDLAIILVSAGIVTLLFKKLKQPLVLGYLVAGFLVGPHMVLAPTVIDTADIQTWADIGVMFLLFSLGLDFSFKKILKMGMAPIVAAVTIIFLMVVTGITVGHAFGWKRMDCIFLGGMLAMSSTTIIYKAFTDMGLRQQKFAGLVMSVLILEDILAIVMMVMLSAIAGGSSSAGGKMLESVLKIVFFLVLWFVVGISVIPWFLRITRKLINNETLLIVALGLCCFMSVLSTKTGFSSAFGAFVMGSILAETVEGEKIEKLVEPVKNLFGAMFFVSVGMLVDPKILAEYALPIIILVLAIIIGQAIFGTFGFMLSGQSLKSAMRCGFSMAQIGEFSFIIASMGLSLGVIGKFLYPVVVAVSVITTFLTPYMIKAAVPCYDILEKRLPKRWIKRLNHISSDEPSHPAENNNWKKLIRGILINVVVYSILSAAAIALMFTFFLPFIRKLMTSDLHWWANGICGLLTVGLISPFLRSIVVKKNHSDEFRALWTESLANRPLLIALQFFRLAIAVSFIFYICNYLTRFTNALMISIATAAVIMMILSRRLKKRSISLERMFIQNLRSKDIAAVALGKNRPLYADRLLDRDIHISDVDIPEDSRWAGKTLRELDLRGRFGVLVSSILRGHQRINIPGGHSVIFPQDKIEVIGSDEQLSIFNEAVNNDVVTSDTEIEKHEMQLRKMVISECCPLLGKTLKESGIRETYGCMVVGLEEGKENISFIDPVRRFNKGDVIWIVGEINSLKKIENI